MSAAISIVALALATVLVIAGAAKMADLEGSRKAVAAFGIPARLARMIGTVLPVAELATAALLISGVAGAGTLLYLGAFFALAMLAAFCGGITINLIRGRAPECHCFGQLHSTPVSELTLLRSGGLFSLATFVASGGNVAVAAVAAAALVFAALLLRLRTWVTPTGGVRPLSVGSPAPDFELPGLDGSSVSLAQLLRPGRSLLLVFADPQCGPCIELAPEIAEWQRRYGDALTVAVIERRGERGSDAVDTHGRRNVLLQRTREIADRYRVDATPSALLIGPDGRVKSEPASGGAAIRALVVGDAEAIEPTTAPVQLVPGGTIVRRELIVRAATAWAVASGLFVAPAGATRAEIEIKCRFKQCGNRCCPKKASCRQRGGRKVCICPDGRPACKNRCCPETFVCRGRGRRRRCVCPRGYAVCSGRCVRTRTDPRNCGRCGHKCPAGTACVNGVCEGGDGTGTGPGGSGTCDCPPGQTCCGGECTDLNASGEHCGDCERPCPAGQTCCEGRCRSLPEDPDNCGRCGRRCAGGEVCSDGQCRRRCQSGLTNCDGSCVDTRSDNDHCGGCAGCTGPFDTGECCNGECCNSVLSSTCCAGGCKNLGLDDDNCGACGNVCPPNSFCRFGTCSPF